MSCIYSPLEILELPVVLIDKIQKILSWKQKLDEWHALHYEPENLEILPEPK